MLRSFGARLLQPSSRPSVLGKSLKFASPRRNLATVVEGIQKVWVERIAGALVLRC